MNINNLTFIYKFDLTSKCKNDTCPICRENLTDKCLVDNCTQCVSIENLCIGTCNHAYHKCCLEKWFLKNSYGQFCPICNTKIKIIN